MFENVNSLPRPEPQFPLHNRNLQADRHHRCFDVGGHVIGALVGVPKVGHRRIIAGWHEPRKERLQIGLHLGISVFLDQQRCGGVLDHKCQQTVGTPAYPPTHIVGEFVQASAVCAHLKCCMHAVKMPLDAQSFKRYFVERVNASRQKLRPLRDFSVAPGWSTLSVKDAIGGGNPAGSVVNTTPL